MKGKYKLTRWQILLILYGGIMLYLLFARALRWTDGIPYRDQLLHNANFIPFRTIKTYIAILRDSGRSSRWTESIINLGGNIFLFIPAGLLFPRVWPRLRRFLVFLAFCAGVILLVETVQLFTFLGNFDVDDLILNHFGMCIGYLLFRCKKTK